MGVLLLVAVDPEHNACDSGDEIGLEVRGYSSYS
jgi:hypothetical protein